MRLPKVLSYVFLSTLFYISLMSPAEAVCPACVVVAGAGVGLSRWLHIDDFIIGIWIGGLTVSLIGWFLGRLDREKNFSRLSRMVIALFFYLMTFVPFYLADLFAKPVVAGFYDVNRDANRLFFGILSGSFVFLIGIWLHQFLKKKNNQRSFFPFQKVILPIGGLLILSLIFYFFIQ